MRPIEPRQDSQAGRGEVMPTLTDTKIRNTKPGDKPITLNDGNGLYLDIRPTGAKI